MPLTHRQLSNLPIGFTVKADDIAALSGQNRVKGIHPIFHKNFYGVIILCTIGGQHYPNEWLDDKQKLLKYFLEGRKHKGLGKKLFNPNITSNLSVIKSRNNYPILVFTRNKRGELFRYSGKFRYIRMFEDPSEGSYFILQFDDAQHINSQSYSKDERKELIKRHIKYERDRDLLKVAIKQRKRTVGNLQCEVCEFDFKARYGKRGEDFLEGHLIRPLSSLYEDQSIQIEDIALICSNCHRMIHRKFPWPSIDDMKEIVKQNEKNDKTYIAD